MLEQELSPSHRPERQATRRTIRLTPDKTQVVLTAYEAGATMAALVEQYGVHRTTISELLKRQGIATRQKRRGITEGEVDQAVTLYTSGLSLEAIGRCLSRNHNTIYRHLKKRGVKMRGVNGLRK